MKIESLTTLISASFSLTWRFKQLKSNFSHFTKALH